MSYDVIHIDEKRANISVMKQVRIVDTPLAPAERSRYVAQVGLKLECLSDSPASAS
jgi:hypothetical protein